MEKQAKRALFLANYLLKNKPEDPAIEKLLKNLSLSGGEANTSMQSKTLQKGDQNPSGNEKEDMTSN